MIVTFTSEPWPWNRFVVVAFWSEEEVSWRRGPRDLFSARPGSTPGRIWPKIITIVRDHQYFISTKFHLNPSSGSGEEVENVKSLRTTRTDDGRSAMTIAHLSLRLSWAKKKKKDPQENLISEIETWLKRIAYLGQAYITRKTTPYKSMWSPTLFKWDGHRINLHCHFSWFLQRWSLKMTAFCRRIGISLKYSKVLQFHCTTHKEWNMVYLFLIITQNHLKTNK